MILKFCNIKNIFETRIAGKLKIPYLGFHLVSENDFKRLPIIKSCVRELRSYFPTTIPVLITKERKTSEIIELINQIEFGAVQLHYPDSDEQISSLRGTFGKNIEIFQVITPDQNCQVNSDADITILDKSFIGGTSRQIDASSLSVLLEKIKGNKILLAGGISMNNVHNYEDLNISGFDIQSSLKSEATGKFENTNYNRMLDTAKILGYGLNDQSGQVGFAIQDIFQNNSDLLEPALEGQVDFLHVDISDGFVVKETDLNSTGALIAKIRNMSTHIPIQLHIFAKSEDSVLNILNQLKITSEQENTRTFVHINRDNFQYFGKAFTAHDEVYFSVDVKDLIDELFPWEQFIKKHIFICLQSKEHKDRVQNLNQGLKMINYSSKHQTTITMDRGIDFETVLGVENLTNLNFVCGTYLRENISRNYALLKQFIANEN